MRPGRSVTIMRPSGRKARPHGVSRPVRDELELERVALALEDGVDRGGALSPSTLAFSASSRISTTSERISCSSERPLERGHQGARPAVADALREVGVRCRRRSTGRRSGSRPVRLPGCRRGRRRRGRWRAWPRRPRPRRTRPRAPAGRRGPCSRRGAPREQRRRRGRDGRHSSAARRSTRRSALSRGPLASGEDLHAAHRLEPASLGGSRQHQLSDLTRSPASSSPAPAISRTRPSL